MDWLVHSCATFRSRPIGSFPFGKLGWRWGAVNVTACLNTEWVTSILSAPTTLTQAFTYALDPTSAQASALRSHVGGSRFAYNALLGLVKDNWDENRAKKDAGLEVAQGDYVSTSHFALLYLWAEKRDERAPWWAENGSSTYNDAAQRLSKAFTNFRKGRSKFPRFKRRGRLFVMAFAAGCLLFSVYGFLAGAWPFGLAEIVWASIAWRRFRLTH